jgi:hypothetical protein
MPPPPSNTSSLDTALSLIHASQKSLKRAETFATYLTPTDHHVQDPLVELFVFLLVPVNTRHDSPGFEAAKREMEWYRPSTDFATAGLANGGEANVDEPIEMIKGDRMISRQGLILSYLHRPLLRGRTSLSSRTLTGGPLHHTTDGRMAP